MRLRRDTHMIEREIVMYSYNINIFQAKYKKAYTRKATEEERTFHRRIFNELICNFTYSTRVELNFNLLTYLPIQQEQE